MDEPDNSHGDESLLVVVLSVPFNFGNVYERPALGFWQNMSGLMRVSAFFVGHY